MATPKRTRKSAATSVTIADKMNAVTNLARQSAAELRSMAQTQRATHRVRALPPYPLSDLIDALNELSDAYDDFGETFGFKKFDRIIDYFNAATGVPTPDTQP